MPDLITHVAGAYLVKRGIRIAGMASLFYLGAILPDLLSRPIHLIRPALFPSTQPLHSPIGVFLACWLISLFFRSDQRKTAFWLLWGGSIVHFLLDMLQKHLVGGYAWLFPFSFRLYSFGFIRPEDSLYFLPLTLAAVLIVYLIGRRKSNASVTRGVGRVCDPASGSPIHRIGLHRAKAGRPRIFPPRN